MHHYDLRVNEILLSVLLESFDFQRSLNFGAFQNGLDHDLGAMYCDLKLAEWEFVSAMLENLLLK